MFMGVWTVRGLRRHVLMRTGAQLARDNTSLWSKSHPRAPGGTGAGARSRFWTAANTKPGEANFTRDLERSRANHGVTP